MLMKSWGFMNWKEPSKESNFWGQISVFAPGITPRKYVVPMAVHCTDYVVPMAVHCTDQSWKRRKLFSALGCTRFGAQVTFLLQCGRREAVYLYDWECTAFIADLKIDVTLERKGSILDVGGVLDPCGCADCAFRKYCRFYWSASYISVSWLLYIYAVAGLWIEWVLLTVSRLLFR